MSEILKPILLDETGQVTNTKLSEHTSQMGEALQTIADAINGLGNITNNDGKINTPKNSDGTISNGISGQILQTNGDGTTQWVDKPSGSTSTGGIVEETDPTVPEWAKQPTKPTYTAEEIGADASGTAENEVSAHNSDSSAHNRLFNDKVNTSDIIDNLTTDDSSKVLSAAQGVILKSLVDKKVDLPKDKDGNTLNGTSGQILQSNGDGTTKWTDKPSGSTSSGGSTVIASEAYDTVAALKGASLSVGDIVKTRGFYAPGDGGDAEYKISDTIPAQYKYCGAKEYEIALVQKLNDGKYALYIPRGGEVNVKACGAKGNCVVAGGSVKVKGDDDSEILQAVFNICANWYTAEKTEQWSIYFPVGNYRIDNPIELAEGSAYRVRGETNTGFSFMTDLSGNSCSIVSYADHIFTGSWERRWNEEVAAGNGKEANYARATYTTIDMRGMEFLPQTSGQDLFHNIVLRCSVIKYNRGRNLATFIRGGLEYCTKISYNNFNGFTYALFCETDLDCFADDKKNNYLNLIDCYISHNYFNGAYASLPIAIRKGGKGDFNYVNFDNNFMDFFEFFFGCAVNFTGNANYNDFHFSQDTFDYMVSLFDQRKGLSLTASTFVSCTFAHMSRVYSDSSQSNYVPSTFNTRPWGPFISGATLTNVSITANHIKDCDGFFSTYIDVNNIGVGYCTCRITGNIFQTLRNECIKYQYCVTDLFVTDPNKPNSNMTYYPTDFYCDIAEEREYTELPVVSRKHNNDPGSNKTDYYFYKGQCVYLNNKKIRFDGTVFRDMDGNEVSA